MINELGEGKITVEIKSDLEAAIALKEGKADYYVGACETGSGGALAMATALVGSTYTITLASPSKVLFPDEIIKAVDDGRRAFGFTLNQAENVLKVLIPKLVLL